MANIELVITIPEEDFERCKKKFQMRINVIGDAIANGTPLDKIRAEIEQKIEQERFARSVFRGEEKDTVKAEQCTGSIFAYNNVIKLIDEYRK